MNNIKVYLNGELVPKEDACISIFDHGLLYGDGVFEGLRVYNGRVFRLAEHVDRLFKSACAINLRMPWTSKDIHDSVLLTVRANSLQDAYVRLVVTRGTGDLGLDPRKCPKPSIFIIADQIVLYPEQSYTNGLEVAVVSTRRNIPDALSPGIKSLNYLNNIMAKIEANLLGVPEAIMLNAQGYVAECTGDNIFIVRAPGKTMELVTPPNSAGALAGITRACVMDLAGKKLGLCNKEELLTTYDLYTATECFLTGTAAEVIPVVKIDGRVVGNGQPGTITKKLITLFRELTRTEGVPVYKTVDRKKIIEAKNKLSILRKLSTVNCQL